MIGTVNRDGKFSSSRGYSNAFFGRSARDVFGSPLGDRRLDETEDSSLDARGNKDLTGCGRPSKPFLKYSDST